MHLRQWQPRGGALVFCVRVEITDWIYRVEAWVRNRSIKDVLL